MSKDFKSTDNNILVVGKTEGHLYQSEFFREILKIKSGPPPQINLFNEKNNGLIIHQLITKKFLKSVHDVSSGGIILTLVEMCSSGKVGARIKIPKKYTNPHKYLFGEDQSRYIIEVSEKDNKNVINILENNSIYYENIGKTQEKSLDLDTQFSIKLEDLKNLSSRWFNEYFK